MAIHQSHRGIESNQRYFVALKLTQSFTVEICRFFKSLDETLVTGPSSPLLSNILLNELDRELERRGHRFVRYADDANIYVCSHRAGERVMASVERFLIQRLKLTLNREKSRVARPWNCDYLGYGMSWHKQPKLKVATMSLVACATDSDTCCLEYGATRWRTSSRR